MSAFDFFWIFIVLTSLLPFYRMRKIEMERIKLIRSIEKQRGSRLITIIHRQDTFSILGLPISKFINIEDSEQVLRAIRLTPDDMPIDIILHTPGGLVIASEQIADALRKHPAKVTAFIPHYAMSGGTLIALSADEIVMDQNAVLGPVDPQIGQYPAASIVNVLKQKDINEIDDDTLILADIAAKALVQVEESLLEILERKLEPARAEEIARTLSQGKWTHDYPITCDKLAAMGLTLCNEMPREIYALMELYPQPAQRRPSVQFIPLPYGKENNGGK